MKGCSAVTTYSISEQHFVPQTKAPFTLLRFCYYPFLLHRSSRSHCSVSVKKRKERPPFLCVHTDLPDNKNRTKAQRKTSVFVRSHYSVLVKPIVEYWSVFKNLRFCAFTLIRCVFKNLRFCGYPLLTAFSKTSVFVPFMCGSV